MDPLALLYVLKTLLQESSKAFMEYSNHEAGFLSQAVFMVIARMTCRNIVSYITSKNTILASFENQLLRATI